MHLIRKSLLLVQLPLILNTSYSLAMHVDANSLLINQEYRASAPPRLYHEHQQFEPSRMGTYGHEPAKMVPFGHEPAKMVPFTSTSGGGHQAPASPATDGDFGQFSEPATNIGTHTYNPCPQSKEFYRQTSYTIFRRHEYNCARFYMCNFGKPFEFSCPAGQLWDQRIKVCNFASAVDCEAEYRNAVYENS